ncbi:gliding motility-associated C-terminal domain-containing protein [Hymenobacter profundi]|uniref:Gliding motility-associated C-terminal domain-containing protein n=1 Tax=Hymenobacter profundi TaxID=1982110 RepID=A0ABS6WUH0_9BACT|nr:gliding motility-associated C-terminal domain-containing protein [Hymenobacter profundi]MBW3127223.1 gliding motility-associated C-terminal domain-containing protein [Hymenobacter profundi]
MNLSLLCWGRRLFLGLTLAFLLLLGLVPRAQGSHIRAGDIQAKSDTTAARNPRRIFFKMILYTARSSPVKQESATFFFGDGTNIQNVPRTGFAQVSADTDINVFYFEHTYNALGQYNVSFVGELRKANILNMSPPTDRYEFYIATRITIDPALGINRAPVLTAPAIDKAATNQVYLHNPAAYDADGDSLTYELAPSQRTGSLADDIIKLYNNIVRPTDIPGFQYPNTRDAPGVQVPYVNATVGAKSIFQINRNTGLLVWNAPSSSSVGEYNTQVIVKEWRRVAGARPRLIGQVIRDMQIIVEPSTNLRPEITIPRDICVVAGTTVNGAVTATDPDRNPVDLFAYGGIFPPATFGQTSLGPPTARGTFQWNTECNDVRRDPYLVTFKAQDRPVGGNSPLIDEKVWSIRVVGPPPQNLQAQLISGSGARATLTWDRYICQQASQILIFRKEGPSNFNPDSCTTGIPAGLGFVQVGAVGANLSSFVDDNNGQGLQRGKTYCYRIYAVFPLPKGGESIASAEACVTISGRSALMRNVTVDRTDANGQITVRWSKPTSSAGFTEPAGYRLFRATGQSANPTQQVYTTTNLNDTVFVDTGLNTVGTGYNYRLEFFTAASTTPESVGPASSVLLTGRPDQGAAGNVLNWTYNVPWNNALQPTVIFRREQNSTTFTQLATVTGTATGGTYTDRSVTSGDTYCYYVRTIGSYSGENLPKDLINLSQELCIRAVPCTPVLTLRSLNCDSLSSVGSASNVAFPPADFTYTNRLTWTLDSNNPAGCNPNGIVYYRIFYQATADAPFALIDSVTTMSYVHRNLPSSAGCYQVQAVDNIGQRSNLSNQACAEDCLFFLLPNIFTPNGDGVNDTFVPKISSPVRRITFRAFNRWGVKVYEGNQDPRINWSGGGNVGEGSSTPRLADGMYFYQAEVEFLDFNNTKRTYKGWVQINR